MKSGERREIPPQLESVGSGCVQSVEYVYVDAQYSTKIILEKRHEPTYVESGLRVDYETMAKNKPWIKTATAKQVAAVKPIPKPKVQTPDGLTLADVSLDHPGLKQLEDKRKKRIQDQSRQDDKIEVNYYVVLVFDSVAQRLEFVEQIKDVDVEYEMYYDGVAFAEKFGIVLEPTGLPPHKDQPVKAWKEMVNEQAIEEAYERSAGRKTSHTKLVPRGIKKGLKNG